MTNPVEKEQKVVDDRILSRGGEAAGEFFIKDGGRSGSNGVFVCRRYKIEGKTFKYAGGGDTMIESTIYWGEREELLELCANNPDPVDNITLEKVSSDSSGVV